MATNDGWLDGGRRMIWMAWAAWAAGTACRGGIEGGLLLGDGGANVPSVDGNRSGVVDSNRAHDANNADDPNQAANPNIEKMGSRTTQYQQGLFRGQDPRLVLHNGAYFFTGYLGGNLTLYKSKSMVDLGVGKNVAGTLGSALGSPFYIDSVGGQKVGAYFIFGSTALFVNTGDPYDDASAWRKACDLPWTDVGAGFNSVPFDFEVFKNPQDGPYKGRWYLVWVRADTSQGYIEHIYASEITALSTSFIQLSQTAGTAANRIVTARGSSDWADVVVEAPGAAISGQSVTLAYSGNGASLTLYALGLTTLTQGADPQRAGAWIDLSHGECDGFPGGSQPVFAKTADVTGPGVARFVKSPDGSEDWMIYNAKIFDTFDPSDPRREVQQVHNEMWSRYINIQQIKWRTVTCSGQSYTVPDLGQPLAPGQVAKLPAGDPGPTAKSAPFRIEAESMISFGTVMGPSIQGLQAPASDTMVLAVNCDSCSAGYKQGNLVELAQDAAQSPKQSGLLYRNCPPASGIKISHGNTQDSLLDLFVGGSHVRQLLLPATGNLNTYKTDTFSATVAVGEEVRIVYQDGQGTQVNLDYIELLP